MWFSVVAGGMNGMSQILQRKRAQLEKQEAKGKVIMLKVFFHYLFSKPLVNFHDVHTPNSSVIFLTVKT